jgi:putative ABC transport system permease protein
MDENSPSVVRRPPSSSEEWVMKVRFWLRWAGRDLRQRWLQVIAIALIISLGTGIYAGFGGQEEFRLASLDASYGNLNMYDLRLRVPAGTSLPQAEAVSVLSEVDGVTAVEPRLLLDTLLEVVGSDPEILVMGQLIGVQTAGGGPHVNKVFIEDGGRSLTAADANQAILEFKFARYYDVAPGARLALSGGLEAEVVGVGQLPEYFLVMPEGQVAFFMGESSFAAVVMPLTTVQAHAEQPDRVNDLLLTLAEGADPVAVQAAVEQVLAAAFPGVGVTITSREDDPVYNMLYHDAVEDQVTMNFLAFILLAGAAMAAFNLAGRIVESQRRQIGISMALGVPRAWIALRPLLMGLQIALLGTLFGLLLGLMFGRLFFDMMFDFAPLPYWSGSVLHWSSFLAAAGLGILLPVLATLLPVWRAVRTPPLDAIHGHLAAKSSGLNRWLKGVRLPGSSFAQMPVKNALRSVRRSGLTLLGIAIAAILLTVFLGLLDTFVATLDKTEEALLHQGANRLVVNLNTLYPANHANVENVVHLATEDGRPLFVQSEKGLILGGRLRVEGAEAGEALPTMLEYFDAGSAIWTPNLLAGTLDHLGDGPGLIISAKMADDWGLQVGDTAVLEHPRREGLMGVNLVESRVTITGIHGNPMRPMSYVNRSQAPPTGLDRATNVLLLVPAPDVTPEAARRILFAQPGVTSVQTVAQVAGLLDDALELLTSVLRVFQVVVIFMAFLIAYNATSINVDDRIREIATMFAFGVRPRTVLWMQMGENLMLGLAGTALGLALGWPLLQQFMAVRMETMLEEIGLVVTVSPVTLLLVVVLTAGVVALTPLVNFGRLQQINIPNTLRVME